MRKHTWRIPLIVAVLTMVGLISALLGTGMWRVIAWIILSVPVAITGWYIFIQSIAGKSK